MAALKALRASAALLLLGSLLFPSFLGAEDDFLDAYKQGLKAIETRQWNLAAENMRRALAGRPEESARLPKKAYFRKYLPHYFLGVALFELGDCEGALESWAESERQGVVTRRKIFSEDLVRSREKCQVRDRLTAPLERQHAKSDSDVNRASNPKRDGELQATDARRVKTRSPHLAEEQEGDDKGQPNQPIQEIGPPPAELDSAVKAFLDGDYPRVIAILEDFFAYEEHAIAHTHLLRSAALFAWHRLRDDEEHLILARGEARAAHATEVELNLSKLFFSPGFREFFHSMKRADRED